MLGMGPKHEVTGASAQEIYDKGFYDGSVGLMASLISSFEDEEIRGSVFTADAILGILRHMQEVVQQVVDTELLTARNADVIGIPGGDAGVFLREFFEGA